LIKVYQTLTVQNDGTGDCFNACVASLLELPLNQVQDVLPHHPGVWFLNWRRWFKTKNLMLTLHSKLKPPKGYSIASVYTSRTYPEGHKEAGDKISHACVAYNGIIVHDPFPGSAEDYELQHYYTITPYDPEDDD
jgi:hypothetical protein